MAVAYASDQEAEATATGADLVITKPVSLAAGDLMVALLYGRRNIGTWATLSGWTKLGNATSTDGTDSNLTVLAKVADSGDAAASDFTFTPNASHEEKKGVLYRITGDFSGGIAALVTSDFDNNVTLTGGTPSTATGGVTPVGLGSLLIMAVMQNVNSGSYSAYSVANNDPTWTERAEGTIGGAVFLSYGTATATFSPQSATGNYTVTPGATGVGGMCLISISETTPVTVSPAVVTATLAVQAPTVTAGATVTVSASINLTASIQAPTVTLTASKWTNTDKNSASWTNQAKS